MQFWSPYLQKNEGYFKIRIFSPPILLLFFVAEFGPSSHICRSGILIYDVAALVRPH